VLFSLKRLQQEFGATMTWRAYELRPAGSPPISPEYLARIEKARPVFAQSMRNEFGIDINSGPFGINSRPSLILDKYAEAHGAGEAYHAATLEAYWHKGQDISDPAVLRALAVQTGLAADALDLALDDPTYANQVDADIAQARAYGLDGVPAVVINNAYLVMGAQPYSVFKSAMRKIRG
jgi:predicted DsbA family dithiol-disulfide isomerase